MKGAPVDLNNPVSVYTLSNPLEAEMVKNYLLGEGIRCYLDGGLQAAESGLTGFPINVLVPASDADRARKLIHEHEIHKKRT
jgi:hypothetical protein